jgi:ATP-dependent DNA helicase
MAPEAAVEEEERLLRERREQEEQAATELARRQLQQQQADLSAARFQQLDKLLDKAGLYTQFLTEQMRAMHEEGATAAGGAAGAAAAEAAEDDEAAAAAGSKRKKKSAAVAAAAAAGKRARGAGALAAAAAASAAASAKGGACGSGGGGGKKATKASDNADADDADAAEERRRLRDTEATRQLCPLIKGDLRDYQLKGVRWMISLWQNGLNGILADQMGLGKTVQTVAFLSHLRSKGIPGPFLVIGPLSTLPNWVSEIRRFCPDMDALLYHGSRDERAALRAERLDANLVKAGGKGAGAASSSSSASSVTRQFPVVVTSFEIVMADGRHLARHRWKYVIVDEGHRLKNSGCRLLRELRQIPAENKLLLTGTPLQNNLAELWSLLNFLLPDIFGSLADFESWFDFSGAVAAQGGGGLAAAAGGAGAAARGDNEIVAAEQRDRVVSKLHALLRPFMLRRIKADVEIALPRKLEVLLYAPMAEAQKRLNAQLLAGSFGEEMRQMADLAGGRAPAAATAAKLNNVLMQMRKNCNHPDLITGGLDGSVVFPAPEVLREQCGKLALLERVLSKLRDAKRGHKVLIFSQMTRMLDLLDAYFDAQGEKPLRLDGSVPWQQRQEAIRAFNDPAGESWIFLLSTRAGGLGINLTAADTVIIYDRSVVLRQFPGTPLRREREKKGRRGGGVFPRPLLFLFLSPPPPSARQKKPDAPPPTPTTTPLQNTPNTNAATGTPTKTSRPWTAATASARPGPCSSSASPPPTASRARCCARPRASARWSASSSSAARSRRSSTIPRPTARARRSRAGCRRRSWRAC